MAFETMLTAERVAVQESARVQERTLARSRA